ncbi:MAG: pyrophosphatase PpaX [Culicoidibacterales bacterium]
MKYDTLLFDLDGTLLDTNELILQSFAHVFDKYLPDYKYTQADLHACIGPTLTQTFTRLAPERAEELTNAYRQWNIANHDRLVTIFPDVKETLMNLQAQGYQLAIVTSKRRDVVEMGLKLCELEAFFSVVVTFDDVTNHKPEPDALHLALEQFPTVKKALMIGDNSHDIHGAKNAGIDSVGVAWSIKGRDFIESLTPTYIIDSMTELLHIVAE